MGHSIIKCPNCDSWIMEGHHDWNCDKCDYHTSESEWKKNKLESIEDKIKQIQKLNDKYPDLIGL